MCNNKKTFLKDKCFLGTLDMSPVSSFSTLSTSSIFFWETFKYYFFQHWILRVSAHKWPQNERQIFIFHNVLNNVIIFKLYKNLHNFVHTFPILRFKLWQQNWLNNHVNSNIKYLKFLICMFLPIHNPRDHNVLIQIIHVWLS